jgi:predicted Zn-dependent protease
MDSLLAEAESLDRGWVEPIVERGALAQLGLRLADAMRDGSGEERLRRGLAHAERALRLDPDDPGALQLSGSLRLWIWQRYRPEDPELARLLITTAEEHLRRAVNGHPDKPRVWRTLSELSVALDRHEEAARYAEQAYRADPYSDHSGSNLFQLFAINFELGDDEAAREWCELGVERHPDAAFFQDCRLQLLAWSEVSPPDMEAAEAAVAETLRLYPAGARQDVEPYLRTTLAAVAARAGARDRALSILAAAGGDDRPGIEARRAGVHALLGDEQTAMDILTRLVQDRPENRNLLQIPALRALHGTPGFEDLRAGG